MTISLCMIVKNESKQLALSLESVKDYVDEIIIVDTGSTDNTKEIASLYTSHVYDFTWNSSFSDARNYSIEHATCDWILWMDADEVFVTNTETPFEEIDNQESHSICSIKMKHFITDIKSICYEHYKSYHHRIFRNHQNRTFLGNIHESISLLAEDDLDAILVLSTIELHHSGYIGRNTKEKVMRNLTILLEEKEKTPDNGWLDYHIAVELYQMNEIEKSFHFINYAIRSFLAQELKPPALFYKLKYDILINTKSYDNAYIGIDRVIELYPDYVDLHFYRGVLLYTQKKYELAIKSFQYCIVLGESNSNYLIKSGTGTFYSYYYIGECYLSLLKYSHAKISFEQALAYNPCLIIAQDKLAEISAL